MALITWDESYSVKVSMCDEDHKKLFSLLNTLHDAMKAGHGSQVLQQVVKDLAGLYEAPLFTRRIAASPDELPKLRFP